MDSSRSFIAVKLDPSLTGVLERTIQGLKNKVGDVRWSSRDQLHLTLKFLGNVDNRELPALCSKLHEACAGIEPFCLELKGLGTFPKHKPPRVVWVAVDEGMRSMQLLNLRLDEKLFELGFPRERRAYTPHLTLGRVGRRTDLDRLQQAIASASDQFALRCEINQVQLLASVKDKGRVTYELLDSVEL